jgi:myo-inositol-1(or 4)-monophosphatase
MIVPETDLAAIESAAVEFAQGAGDLLAGYFGRVINIEYKDRAQQDPVTTADKETQAYLERRIAERFPAHGILGEEDDASADGDSPAPDFLWVLDPLDGTTNFMNGLPVYASSIGVLHRGVPIAGAVYIPWPTDSGNGIVVHGHAGGGAFANGEPIAVYQTDKLRGDRLMGLPGSFGASTRVGKGLKGQPLGQLRVTGSIAYELAMTAMGVMQFAVIGAPRMWDMLGGVIAVQEAGGTVMTRLPGRNQWHTMDSLVPGWNEKPPSMAQLRKWVAPLVVANPTLAPLIADNLRPRRRPFRRALRGIKKALAKS